MLEIKVHHSEKAFKDKNGKQWFRLCFDLGDYNYGWILSDKPYEMGATVKVKLGKIISQDFNNGRLTLVFA